MTTKKTSLVVLVYLQCSTKIPFQVVVLQLTDGLKYCETHQYMKVLLDADNFNS